MVEITPSHQGTDYITRLVRERTQMTISELVPFLTIEDLAKFYQINKTCKAILTPGDSKCLRFDILLDKQNLNFGAPDWK